MNTQLLHFPSVEISRGYVVIQYLSFSVDIVLFVESLFPLVLRIWFSYILGHFLIAALRSLSAKSSSPAHSETASHDCSFAYVWCFPVSLCILFFFKWVF